MTEPTGDSRPEADYVLVEGREAFHAAAVAVATEARREIVIFSYELDRRIFGSEDFLSAARKFTLQHAHARMRILINAAGRTARNSHKLVELGRQLTSFIEFRDLPDEHSGINEEYMVADGRRLLHRLAPDQLIARDYQTAPHMARLKLRDFEPLWNESPPAQELRDLRM
ncbi:MAG: hypothetical protein AABY95_01810 [Pseudomonadota bacterium]